MSKRRVFEFKPTTPIVVLRFFDLNCKGGSMSDEVLYLRERNAFFKACNLYALFMRLEEGSGSELIPVRVKCRFLCLEE
jgi:hypothetical protein